MGNVPEEIREIEGVKGTVPLTFLLYLIHRFLVYGKGNWRKLGSDSYQ
jgi:hypothetical protein